MNSSYDLGFWRPLPMFWGVVWRRLDLAELGYAKSRKSNDLLS